MPDLIGKDAIAVISKYQRLGRRQQRMVHQIMDRMLEQIEARNREARNRRRTKSKPKPNPSQED